MQKIIPPLLATPGPVPLSLEVRSALALPALHHRTPEFEKILESALVGLKSIFLTQMPCMALTSTGTGAMEAALVNVLSPGDEVLCIIGGKFGERWAEMATTFGLNVHALQVEWGLKLDLKLVKEKLLKFPAIKAILCQACETSTGVLFPIKELAEITKDTTRLLLIDAITALGCTELPMDKWGLDVVIGGSQKAFMLPTGLSFIAMSEKAWLANAKAKCIRYYFDLEAELQANTKNQTRFSSSVTPIRALSVVLQTIEKNGGLENLLKIMNARSTAFKAALTELKLTTFPDVSSPSLTVIRIPEQINGKKVRAYLEDSLGVVMMGGQDQLEGRVLRIGHMGAIDSEDIKNTIRAVHEATKEFNFFVDEELAQAQERLFHAIEAFDQKWKELS